MKKKVFICVSAAIIFLGLLAVGFIASKTNPAFMARIGMNSGIESWERRSFNEVVQSEPYVADPKVLSGVQNYLIETSDPEDINAGMRYLYVVMDRAEFTQLLYDLAQLDSNPALAMHASMYLGIMGASDASKTPHSDSTKESIR